MPPVDQVIRKPKKRRPPPVRSAPSPDQADRERSPSQRAADRRAIQKSIDTANARARKTPDQADRERTPAQKHSDAAAVRQSVATSRVKALRRTQPGSGTRALKKVLEGSIGTIKDVNVPTTGAGPTLHIPVKHKGGGAGFATITASPHVVHVDDKTVAGRTILDFANVGSSILPSVYIPTAGAYEAARGRPQRIKKFAHDFSENDPIYNAGKAGVQVATGDSKGAKKSIKKALHAANQHPGFTLLEAASLKAPLGRGVGAGSRLASRLPGKTGRVLGAAGKTERAPKTLPGTNLVQHRRYSKNAIDKAAQVTLEKIKGHGHRKLKKRAARQTDEAKRQQLEARARAKDPNTLRDREINRAVDEQHSMAEDIRRLNQKHTLKAETKDLKRAKKGGPVASLLAQRIVKPTLKSLKGYRDDLIKIQSDLSEQPAKLSANQQLVGDLEKAIGRIEKGKVSVDEMKSIADRYRRRNQDYQAQLADRGVYDPEQQLRREALPHAVLREGVHKDPEYLAAATKLAGKRAKKTAKTAATRRGRLLQHSERQKRETAADTAQLEARPQREPTAHEALRVKLEAERKVRETQVKGARTRAKKATDKAEQARAQHKAAKKTERANPFLRTDKQPISAKELQDLLEAEHGKGGAAIVSHAPRQSNAFYRSGLEPATGETQTFSGQAAKEGTFDASPEAMAHQNVRSQTIVDAIDNYTDLVDRTARRYTGKGDKVIEGNFKRRGQKLPKEGEAIEVKDKLTADQLVRDLNAHGDIRWRAVRKTPARAPKAQKLEMEDNINKSVVGRDALRNAMSEDATGPGPWAIIPEAAAKRVQAHLDALATNDVAKVQRSLFGGFGRTVLAGSPAWPVGNTVEAGLRSALNRVGPRSWWTGRQMLKEWEGEGLEGKRARVRTVGGGHFGANDRTIYNNVAAFEDGLAADLTRAGKAWRSMPVGKQATWIWDKYTDAVFRANKAVENQFQTAMLGRAARELLLDDKVFKLSKEAIRQASEGGLDPNVASALGREVDKMYGRYSKLKPWERTMIQQTTPFLLWAKNAAEFLVTAPVRHPVATGLSVGAENATEQERASWYNGKSLPPFLRGSVPFEQLPDDWKKAAKKLGMQPGGNFRVSRFTPLGLATDPLGTASGLVWPQIHTAMYAMNGLDWTGRPLKGTGPNGEVTEEDKVYATIQGLLGSTAPGFGVGQRTQAKGPLSLLHSAVGYTPPGKKKGGGGSTVKGGLGQNRFKGTGFQGPSFSSRFK